MGQYLRTMYMDSQASTLELIVESNSFSDFVDKSEYLSTMQQNVQSTANKIVTLASQLNQKKYSLEVEESKAQQLENSDVVSTVSRKYSKKSGRLSLLQETQGSESNYQSLIANNNAQMGVLHCIAIGGCQVIQAVI